MAGRGQAFAAAHRLPPSWEEQGPRPPVPCEVLAPAPSDPTSRAPHPLCPAPRRTPLGRARCPSAAQLPAALGPGVQPPCTPRAQCPPPSGPRVPRSLARAWGRAPGPGVAGGWGRGPVPGTGRTVVGLTGGSPGERAPRPGGGGGQRGEQQQGRRRGPHGGRRAGGGAVMWHSALRPRGEGRWAPAPQECERGVRLQRSPDSARRGAGGRDRAELPASGPGPAPRARRPHWGSVSLLAPRPLGADLQVPC